MKSPIMFLAEGDPETWRSFSGSSRSAVLGLRGHGRTVLTGDADIYGAATYVAKLAAFWPRRGRWVHRYHAGAAGFLLRTRAARRQLQDLPAGVPIIQVGATFDASKLGHPLYCFCDATAAFTLLGGEFGSLAKLSKSEHTAVVARERSVYQKADGIFTFTEGLRRSIIDDFGVGAERVVTTFAGPNLDSVPSVEELETPKSQQPTILFIGRQWERKGGPTLMAAFREVRRVLPESRLLIVGCRPPIEPTAGVEILGLVSREDRSERGLRNLFLTSDIYCMPSRYEPFGMTYTEAMYHGLPCIGPKLFMSEIIDDGRTGWLLSKDDPAELASILISGLQDRARLRRMGAAGREKASALFRWDRATRLMLDFIDRDTAHRG